MTMLTYDPKLNFLTWVGIDFVGFTDEMIQLTPEGGDWVVTKGADGKFVRTLDNGQLAKMTVSLQAESPVNALLSARRLLDRTTYLGAGAMSLTNILRPATLISSPSAFIEAAPPMEFQRDAGAVVWTFVLPDVYIFAGGAVL